ncbi:Cmr2p Ecym_5357 [Eremothecium cymbalariae DBVPG|uniref:Uncharacterized protein n=1 Tax=Eremothecium cymbalariae (strain CBS 270.75 / DBVPG 7215 / KCTC 17166 / NRRL Y-17582) TaxID=931890 RepID=I6NDH3_ERECY|nr:hypothetical protein Ecym_5357 [Eremothecium cymbalariae DBVPG\
MDFSIPRNISPDALTKLQSIIRDFHEGNLTARGYNSKRQQVLERESQVCSVSPVKDSASVSSSQQPQHHISSFPLSPGSAISQSYTSHTRDHSVTSTARTSATHDIQSMTSQSLYRVTTSNSNPVSHNLSPHDLQYYNPNYGNNSYRPMIPLLPRINDQSQFLKESLPSILRARSQVYERETAILGINSRGKETSISWDKLYLRAEKVAHELGKIKPRKTEKILLWYDGGETIEFSVALLGCFIAGLIGVPVSFETYTLNEIIEIIKQTNAKLILISEECMKQLDNLHVSSNSKLHLTKSDFFSRLTFVKTDDLGVYSRAKKASPVFSIPSVSYIEFSRTPLGKLSGVVMKHKVLWRQFENLTDILNSRAKSNWKKGSIKCPYKDGKRSSSRYVILSSLDPTRSTGLVLGTLFNIFSGNLLICVHANLLKRPGIYEYLINKYRADVLLNDPLQLKQVVINYLENPESTISKKSKIDFSCIKLCLTSCTTIDTEVADMIVHKWLKNLGCMDASQAYSPMLTLLDFGGIFISVRDQLGRMENFPLHDPKLRLQDDVFIDKEQLKDNIVQPSISAMINSSSSIKDFLRLTTFGYPIPDSTICVVDPDTRVLVEDLTVGEIWISAPSVTDEFYHMERLTDFVFNAKLNFKKMISTLESSEEKFKSESYMANIERLDTIMTLVPPQTSFLRTKLIGFIHNGKIYTLSLIEDMFLQNKLIRLQNWSHTSDVNRSIKENPKNNRISALSKSSLSLGPKRIVQTFYLQHISENLVRTVDKVSEVSAFELGHKNYEHYLVMVVESFLANNAILNQGSSNTNMYAMHEKLAMEQKMNDLTEQIYKILWIFHKIQPFCCLVVPPDSLPRRYCSMEIANRTVESRFLSGKLNSKFVKFQLDNVILDFVPHSSYYNESIFSEHLSKLRHHALSMHIVETLGIPPESTWQTSGLDYKKDSYDEDTGEPLTGFNTIMDILEWRTSRHATDFAFSNGSDYHIAGGSADQYRKLSWEKISSLIACFIKKIVDSKNPLKRGDHVIIMCENTVDYVAIVLACFYCRLVIIPLPLLHDTHSEAEVTFLMNVIMNYDVKRIFVDQKVENLLEQNSQISILLKKIKNQLPKITTITKVKRRSGLLPKQYQFILEEQYGTLSTQEACVVWINRDDDRSAALNVIMSHSTLLKMCKVLKETLKMTKDKHIMSVCFFTRGIGFLYSCLLGIFVGASTSLFSSTELINNPKNLLIGLQNTNVKDIVLSPDVLYMIMDRGSAILENQGKIVSSNEKGKKESKSLSVLKPYFLRHVENIMIPFTGRPRFRAIEALIGKYPLAGATHLQVNYVYEHRFNPFISLRSYLGILPIDIYLDPVSLREGIVNELDPLVVSSSVLKNAIHLQDSGIVSACTEVSIVNPETLEQCYENEIGEIWCCSEANVFDYSICSPSRTSSSREVTGINKRSKITRDLFISQQFRSKIKNQDDIGLSYLRTGDLGFIKTVERIDSKGGSMNLSVLYVLGSINETVEILGLTHFVIDLETTVLKTHPSIENCIIVKTGGLLSCLIECNSNSEIPQYSNITPLVVSLLLKQHGVVLDLCCFVKLKSLNYIVKDWQKNRSQLLEDWLNKKLTIEAQYGVNVGENNSIYLLSDFEKVQ